MSGVTREVLAVIPARGGSRGIAGKNLRPLGGRPLLAYSCDAARLSRLVSRIVVSTDDPQIAEAALTLGAQVPFMRPPELAADDTPMLDVLRHVLAELKRQEGYIADVLVLLQPTSPLRTSEHVDRAVGRLLEGDADSIVSVIEVPHLFSPSSVMRIDDGRLVPLDGSAVRPTRRQEKPQLFARNGPAVLAVRTTVIENGLLYGEDCRPMLMKPEESVDIDAPLDLELAEWLLTRRERLA
jgi:CMP-N,N'-diacetyllegionaminic acid synthase